VGDSVSDAASVASSRLERAVSYHAFLSLLPRIVLPTIVLPKIAEKNSIANDSIANPNDEKVDNVLVTSSPRIAVTAGGVNADGTFLKTGRDGLVCVARVRWVRGLRSWGWVAGL